MLEVQKSPLQVPPDPSRRDQEQPGSDGGWALAFFLSSAASRPGRPLSGAHPLQSKEVGLGLDPQILTFQSCGPFSLKEICCDSRKCKAGQREAALAEFSGLALSEP